MRQLSPLACRTLCALVILFLAQHAFAAAEKSAPDLTVYTNLTVIDGTGAPAAKLLNEDF